MDLMTVLTTACIGAIIQTMIIIALYHLWIIPKIVNSTKDELMKKLDEYKVNLTTELSDKIAQSVKECYDNLISWVSGKKGNDARQLSLARSYLDSRLPSDPDIARGGDDELITEVITQGVIKYGKPVIDAVIGSVRPSLKKDNSAAKNEPSDGWEVA